MRITSKLPAVVVVTLVVLAAAVVVTRFNVTTDLGVFLPRGQSVLERVLMSQLDRGSTTNLVFAGISGGDAESLADLNRELADRLSAEPGFVQVLNGERGMSEADQKWVMDNRYRLTPSNLAENSVIASTPRARTASMIGWT